MNPLLERVQALVIPPHPADRDDDGADRPPHEPGSRFESRTTYLLLGTLLAALLLLRGPASLLHPQFWAEDGTLFFQEAFNLGFLQTALRPVSGYLCTFPRLVAGLSLLFPMGQAPLVFNLAAFIVQLLPGLYLLSPRMARFMPSFPARVAAALLYISLPASYETYVNLTNSQWHLALTAVCILVARQPVTAWVQALEVAVMALFSLSGPFSVMFVPLVAPRLVRAVKGARPDRDLTLAVIVAAGATAEALCALTGARIGAAATWGHLTLQELATVVSMHTFFNSLFGVNGFTRFYRSLPTAAYGFGLLALALFLFVAVRDRVRPLLILFYLSALTIALAFAFPLNDPRIWLHPQAGPRYFLFACIFVIFTLLHLALAARSWRWIGMIGLTATCAVGIPADFIHPGQPDIRWSDNVAVFQTLPAGSDFSIPVVPLYNGGMVLHKTSALREQSPLARLGLVRSPARAAAVISRPQRVFLSGAANDSYLRVAGWANDGSGREPAGGVYVRIDDKLFPAVYGLPADVDDGHSCTDCGFSRLIPISEIGPGSHELSLVVLTRDGAAYYQPSRLGFFALNQFFP